MFKIAEKTELNQISLTGMRAIILLGLLIIEPRSLDDIREAFIKLNIMEETHSDDILRIDLNTLKVMGCKISRSCAKTNYKYILSKHPFSLKINQEDFSILKKVYNKLKEEADIKTLIEYDELIKKLAYYMYDEDEKESILGISILKHYDIEIIQDLIRDCEHNRTLQLRYLVVTTKQEVIKNVVAQEMFVKSDKIYLHGYDLDKKRQIVLNLRRLISIRSRNIHKNENISTNSTIVRFIINNMKNRDLNPNEVIVDSSEKGYIVEGTYYNDFYAMQRILSLATKCTVIEPIDFRNNVIEKIKEMRKTYGQ